ncbi:MAG: MTH1187 family thiamine-binding protein [Thermoplasmata archaeon]|nr:MTH1187 family thiamine-binding protein [Thermoplasmata archaeon]
MIIGELTITPLGEGTSVSKYVKAAVEAIKSLGLKMELTPMSTVIEAENLKQIFRAAELGEEAMIKLGAKRVIIDIKIDHRLDKNATMESKRRAILKE